VTHAAWRAADDPRGAHDLCQALSSRRRYEHSRGVAQQAARAARSVRLPGAGRRALLTAAWLHDIGYALPYGPHALAGARALRRAGHERLARIVAHHSNASEKARGAGRPPIEQEFPRPAGGDAEILALLDIADLLTGPSGERVDPAGRLAGVVERHGPDSVSVQALVAHVNRLGADPVTRAIVEDLSAQAVAS
jgi:putative nucleotidyltransferase with HDIG domain